MPAGKVYFNDFKLPYTVKDTLAFQSADVLKTIPKDTAYWKIPEQSETNEATAGKTTDFIGLLKQYLYAAAGIVLLLLLFIVFRHRKN